MQNIIQRELTINASAERIYNAIAAPEQVVKWFPDTVSGDYRQGAQALFSFGSEHQSSVYIEAARPHHYFAYRWVPGGNNFTGDVLSVPNTLVEFRITELEPGRCRVSLTETGFADLPAEIAASSLQQNSNGWDFMLGRLQQYFNAEA
ncbi:SRPBCC family protein [Rheinheimera nanhaiensis]|uniref:Periplasmic protein thiol:disulfide oxidoreductase DsbE n=1 Tax=Rheinheimera nanhaiensis E407-8 TaxID=562729 RepID=I1DXK5_9GAMM|nr:SRPBCC family protein [Rheinheimera nanhaiensis]GAB58783.1 periplasmic protein thiol:disulfide oxidoreductase DsbE [Rheinheimera nanhaiensis E407-8]